jgi:hypothetical protein
VREREGCLNRLAAQSSLNHCLITLEFAREALRDLIPLEWLELNLHPGYRRALRTRSLDRDPRPSLIAHRVTDGSPLRDVLDRLGRELLNSGNP